MADHATEEKMCAEGTDWPVCPHCFETNTGPLNPRQAKAKLSRWWCGDCRMTFNASALTRTTYTTTKLEQTED